MSADKKILLATDLSDGSDEVAAGALELATAIGAEIVSMHVVTEDAMAEGVEELPEGLSYIDVVIDHISQNLIDQIDRVAGDRSAPMRPMVVEGKRAKALVKELEDDTYAYAVVGVRNRSRVGKLLLGSVSQEVLLHSPVPVLAIPIAT